MKEKIYTAPRIVQVEFMLEQNIAVSVNDVGNVFGLKPDDWDEGNIDW